MILTSVATLLKCVLGAGVVLKRSKGWYSGITWTLQEVIFGDTEPEKVHRTTTKLPCNLGREMQKEHLHLHMLRAERLHYTRSHSQGCKCFSPGFQGKNLVPWQPSEESVLNSPVGLSHPLLFLLQDLTLPAFHRHRPGIIRMTLHMIREH